MAYQNIGTPKFFIDHGLWLHSTGVYTYEVAYDGDLASPELLTLNPSLTTRFIDAFLIEIWIPRYAPINYVAFLGHDIKTEGGKLQVSVYDEDIEWWTTPPSTSTINIESERPDYDGFSITFFDDNESYTKVYGRINLSDGSGNANIGAVSIGSTYTMSNAPNLSLSMSREYGGTKEITTYTGGSISNTMWSKPPKWGSLGAWELDDGTSTSQALSRSGRRTWDLKFSYMADSDLWGSNQSLSRFLESDEGTSTNDTNTSDNTELMQPTMDDISGSGATSATYNSVNATITDSNYARSYKTDTFETTEGQVLALTLKMKNASDGIPPYIATPDHGGQYTAGDNQIRIRSESGGSQSWHYITDPDNNVADVINSGNEITLYREFTAAFTASDVYVEIRIRASGTTYGDLDVEISDVSVNIQSQDREDGFVDNLLTGDNFFSQVWHKTLGGTLPFIFQPDSSNNNPDQFAICRFKENSLKATQTAFNVYDISLKIEEVW